MGKVINVSNRLPITIAKDDAWYTFRPSAGGLKSCLESVRETVNFVWMGWPGLEVDPSAEKQLEEELQTRYECLPVFMSEELADLHYSKYCNGTVWPILHSFVSECDYRQRYFDAYVKANELFADKVLEVIEENDIVWVHDYHLMLLPKLIKSRCTKPVKVAFFMHISWPCPQIFRLLPEGELLCDSLLHADWIGFHILKYKLNFIQTCQDFFGGKLDDEIWYKGRSVNVCNRVLSIQPKRIYDALDSEKTRYEMRRIAEKYKGKKLIVGVDRVDYIKGLDLKFKAYDLFLENAKHDVIFEQIAIPSRENLPSYKRYQARVASYCAALNEKYGRVVEYRHQSVDFHYLVALYRSADICIVSSLVDGLNLVAFEYVAAQKDHTGVLLLSKLAGCASVLKTPMQFNPVNTDELARLIKKALVLSEAERRKIQQNLFNAAISNTSAHWAKKLLEEMNYSLEIVS